MALDVPGCGTKRGRETGGVGFQDIVDELLSDITAAGLRDVVLVGHSQAGTVMPRLAEVCPELFRRLVYVACSSPEPGVTVGDMIGKGLHGDRSDQVGWPVDPASCSQEQRYRTMFCNDMDEVQTKNFLRAMVGDAWPMSAYLERDWRYSHLDTTPASYVVCLRDASLPVDWQERFAERFRAQRVVRLDAGHQAMVTCPRFLAELLLAEAFA